ncbi:MAG: hypothetical protein A2174_02520 [Candidatus Portnoybacteria bacterium RBG_13_41_18]|uniref:Uncharacterized protein n=1 Tax=Candidatus Portnoybacteria bacterium RBG_13_41_18 TaxID=1801991 RepID=A0A1G2FAS3_9BACT|nr:MAG: hypothetical protein A2174_02520 [Candidatus Portnoybacteria bacterium RBG_13_41_18]
MGEILSQNGAVQSANPETVLIGKEEDAECLALELKDAFAPGPHMRNRIPKVSQITSEELEVMVYGESEEPEIIGQFCHCPNGQCLCLGSPNRSRQFDVYGRRRS